MKHARPDYDRIQDPAYLIPADEPVLLLRAQDSCAMAAIEAYRAELAKQQAGQDFQDMITGHAVEFALWPKKKLPDLPRAAPTTVQSGFNADTSGTRTRLED